MKSGNILSGGDPSHPTSSEYPPPGCRGALEGHLWKRSLLWFLLQECCINSLLSWHEGVTGSRRWKLIYMASQVRGDPRKLLTSPFTHGHHQMVSIKIILIMFFAAKDGKALDSQQKQDQELTVAQIISSLFQNSGSNCNVGETTKPFRDNLNQMPYDYIVEMTNRFKGLDLVDRVPEKLRTMVRNIVQEVMTKIVLKKKKCEKTKWLSEETLQVAEKRREAKEKGKDLPNWVQISRA